MGQKIRKGNDIRITWSLYDADEHPYNLDGRTIDIELNTLNKRVRIDDFTTSGNSVIFTYYGKDQKYTGSFALKFIENEGQPDMVTFDTKDAFTLTEHSWQAVDAGETPETIQLEVVTISDNLNSNIGPKGDNAGFGTIDAEVDANVGTPSVSVQTSGPDTAKNIHFSFHNLKGEPGSDADVTRENIEAALDSTPGKNLSTEDYTSEEKSKLGALPTNAELEQALGAKYEKPSGGIPSTDMSSAVQTSLGKADSAIQSVKSFADVPLSGSGDVVRSVSTNAEHLYLCISGAGIESTFLIQAGSVSGAAILIGGTNPRLVVIRGEWSGLYRDSDEMYIRYGNSNSGISYRVLRLAGEENFSVGASDLSEEATDYSENIIQYYSKPNAGIPASDLAEGVIPDVSQFITNSVNDLVNYYLKSETYTKAEVQALISGLEEITYATLVSKRNNSQLVPGRWYRITDYVATTVQAGTQSANHPFDVIVLALESNKLTEEAFAALHSGDTYFANNDLSAWKLWYSIDNDTTKFAWADNTNGKGVIYRMIDEFNNDVPYDFKGIQYQVRPGAKIHVSTGPGYDTLITRDTSHDVAGLYAYKAEYSNYGGPSYVYFSDEPITIYSVAKDSSGNVLSYVSLMSVTTDNYDTYTFDSAENDSSLTVAQNCYNNEIKPYKTSSGVIQLNRIIFRTISSGALQCYHNIFGNGCHTNTFGFSCSNNIFGNNFSNNTFGNYSCYNNIFGNGCHTNTFGFSCSNNIFGNNCYNNTFGNNLTSNIFGCSCSNNTFGSYCTYNIFGNSCSNNIFGGNCSNNTFGNYCSNIKFGNAFTTKDYCRYIIVETGNQYIYLSPTGTTGSGSYYQNVKISQGVNMTLTWKTISDSNVNQAYQTVYQPADSQTINV